MVFFVVFFKNHPAFPCDDASAMAAELDTLKIGKSVYYFNLYSRGEHRKESAAVWQDLLGMIRKK